MHSSSVSDPCDLPPDLAKIALNRFGETPEKRRHALVELRARIACLPEAERLTDTSDQSLVRFLRFRKYDMDKALATTQKLQKFANEHSEWTESLHAAENKCFDNFYQVLEKRGPEGEFILCLRPDKNISTFTPEFLKERPLAMVRANLWMITALSHLVEVQVCGIIVCFSFQGFTFRDNLTLSKAARPEEVLGAFKFLSLWGVRLVGMFFFDQPASLGWLWSFARMFLSAKMRERVHMCGSNYQILKKYLPDSSILPVCMGGKVKDGDYSWIDHRIEIERAESKIR